MKFCHTGSEHKSLFVPGRLLIALMVIIILVTPQKLAGQEKKLTLDLKDLPLKEVFKEIEARSEYSVFYSDDLVKDIRVASFKAEGETALEALNRLLPQYHLRYELNGNIIVILDASDTKKDDSGPRTIAGSINDEDGLEIPGVNIYLKGSTKGTISDVNGNFSIEVPGPDAVLVVSSVGYANQEIRIGDKTMLEIVLYPDVTELSEVVVTALGITKEKKALGYAVSDLKGDELTSVKDANIINSLAGKSAGVMISKSAGGPDASTRVVIRGNNSLQGNNQPLYVVDGIPISNNSYGQTTASAEDISVGQGFELGSGIGDLNPEDIESVSILKGPNAAALYGSRAANGVIIFTTKKGSKRKGIGVTFSSNTTIDIPYFQRKYQDIYGFGNNGTATINEDGLMVFPDQLEGSWGAKMEGQLFVDWDGVIRTYDPQPDNYSDFFQTGITSTNTVSIAGGSDAAVYRLSYTDLANRGITPNSNLQRRTVNLRAGTDLTKNLKIDSKITYIYNEAKNRNYQADGHSVSRNYIHMPRSVSDSSLRSYEDEEGMQKVWRDHDRQSNPYWVAYKDYNGDKRDRVLGSTNLTYTINDWLTAMGRIGTDLYYSKSKQIIATGERTRLGTDGQLYEASMFNKELNSDFLFSANKQLGKRINLSGTFGGSTYYHKYESFAGRTTRSSTPDFYNIQYTKDDVVAWTYLEEKKTRSLYGSTQFAYNNFLFLDLTARNDWSSTLPVNNNSYFYPSVTGSFLFTELIKKQDRKLSFGKLRASWAKVGNDTDPYKLQSVYYSASDYLGQPLVYISDYLPAIDLKPEITESYEVGGEFRFFMNRLGLDITYYKSTTKNQIVNADIATSSGFHSAVINAGEIDNKGWEVQFNAEPVRTSRGFSWNTTINYARNRSMVVSLTQGLESLVLANHWNLTVEANPGEPYGNLVGVEIARDENGNKLIGSDGRYVRGERVILGNYNPDWIGGMTNYFKYKHFTASFQIDVRMGGEIYSATNHYGNEKGTFIETIEGRDAWYESEAARVAAGVSSSDWIPTGGYLAEGVLEDGTINNIYMNPEIYWAQFAKWTKEIHEPYIYDASFVKLREIYIGYKVPESFARKLHMSGLEIALTGRNLWIIYKNTPNIDPESVYNASNAQGVEYAAMPTVRNIGFNLKISL